MKHDSRFWDRVAERYYRKAISDPDAYEEKLRITREHLGLEMSVLELGCGTGGTAIAHAPCVKHIHIVDISQKMLDIVRVQMLTNDVDNLSFECTDIIEFAASPRSYNAVLGMSILHLLNDRDAAIAKVFELLEPGGVFISSTVCLGDSMPWFKFVGPLGRAVRLMPLVRVFSEQQLDESLDVAGFVIERQWRPTKRHAAFLVARRPAMSAVRSPSQLS